jgi:hypothetical protein
MMGSVYKNAICNVAATASADPRGGLFFDRDPRMIHPAIIVVQWEGGPSIMYKISASHVWDDGVSEAVGGHRPDLFSDNSDPADRQADRNFRSSKRS